MSFSCVSVLVRTRLYLITSLAGIFPSLDSRRALITISAPQLPSDSFSFLTVAQQISNNCRIQNPNYSPWTQKSCKFIPKSCDLQLAPRMTNVCHSGVFFRTSPPRPGSRHQECLVYRACTVYICPNYRWPPHWRCFLGS